MGRTLSRDETGACDADRNRFTIFRAARSFRSKRDTHDAQPHRPLQRVSTFITQLIATAGQLPQTRERRRADPDEVIAAYRATVERLQKLNEKSA